MPVWFWIAFHLGVFLVLAIDLFGFNRKAHPVSIKEATIWSLVWVALSLGFNLLVWKLKGSEAAIDFFTGYVIEYSLSVDNIFVFVLLFGLQTPIGLWMRDHGYQIIFAPPALVLILAPTFSVSFFLTWIFQSFSAWM